MCIQVFVHTIQILKKNGIHTNIQNCRMHIYRTYIFYIQRDYTGFFPVLRYSIIL